MMKKIIAAILAATMLLSMSTTFAAKTANTSAPSTHYYMDLQAMTEQEYKDASVELQFFVNGQQYNLRTSGMTYNPKLGGDVNEKDLGNALLFRYDPNGKLDQDSMNITFVPIRKIANILGLEILWNDETKNVVLDTPKGKIEFPVGATSITAPDGTTYEEQTYRFPNGDPINITSARDGRVYTTVRFISTFCMPDAKYDWYGTKRLTVTGTLEGTTPQKTPGVNTNYLNAGNGSMNWRAMPNLMAALDGMNYEIDSDNTPGLFSRGVFVNTTAASGVSCTLSILYASDPDYPDNVFKIEGYDYVEEYTKQLPVIEGALKDLVCDADREAIIGLLNQIAETMSVGWTPTKGTTQEAREWRANFQKFYTLNEVNVQFNEYLKEFVITTK